MNVDLSHDYITLGEAARMLPWHPAPCTLWRWRSKGVNGVRLVCIRQGAKWLTTKKNLEVFLAAQTQALTQESVTAQPCDLSAKLAEAGLLPRDRSRNSQ